MKIKALAEELNLDWNSFEDWLLNHQSTYRARRDFFNAVIDGDFDRNQIRSDFAAWLKQSKEAAEQAIIQEEERKSELARLEAERIRADEAAAFERERRMKAIDSMYVSTSDSVSGTKKLELGQLISKSNWASIPWLNFNSANTVTPIHDFSEVHNSLVQSVLLELKNAALDLGCNAIVSVVFRDVTYPAVYATQTGALDPFNAPYILGVVGTCNAAIVS